MTVSLVSMKLTRNASGSVDATPIPAGADAIVTGYASLVTHLATLVADGVSPTQAHVTTVAADWTALKAIIDANQTAAAAAVVITVDKTAITDQGMLNDIFRRALDTFRAAGYHAK